VPYTAAMAPIPTRALQRRLDGTALGDERFAASYLSVKVETLRTWRKQGRGPLYRKLGRCVRYRLSDLFEFVEAQPAGGGKQPMMPGAL
jgi:hypothetical protein